MIFAIQILNNIDVICNDIHLNAHFLIKSCIIKYDNR